ncbi:NDP-hexose 2,3-dehydratase family protein [Streptomyces sp. NPDC053367]|uniref:NDP-hexose 2,3-dehydratase family protein n=1 Tax=Streptomyces sp. NPDC053367 TaxID=3365700 RepID=UPI0037D9527B
MTDIKEFLGWLGALEERIYTRTERVPLGALDDWSTDADTGEIRHRTGRFFSVRGVSVACPQNAVPHWQQPIILQPETGILGILVRRTPAGPRLLLQAKAEPGNINLLQISPTVQATRSNFTGVHQGRSVPYLRYFAEPGPHHRVLVDVRQSEQGSWFLGKRNRNMVVETDDDVPLGEGFRWFTPAEVAELLRHNDLVNMNTRSVLACLPAWWPGPTAPEGGRSLHTLDELLHWISDTRSRTETRTSSAPLAGLAGWRRGDDAISHESGGFFDVIGVRVAAGGREIGGWSQPMIAARGTGLVALFLTHVDGEPHVLLQLRTEPGLVDVAELAPTVQCTPENVDRLPARARPPFLDEVLSAGPESVLYDVTLSDEGGRFHHTRSRHLVVATEPFEEPPGHRWVTLRQLAALLRHSHYVNMQTRSLLACLRAVTQGDAPT